MVILRETAGQRRVLPIFIGTPEARPSRSSMQNIETPRPMTHDLMKNMLDELGAQVERIVVTELRDGTFFAEIVLTAAGRGAHGVEPAVRRHRAGRPHRLADLRRGGRARRGGRVEQPDEEQAEQMVEQFREFIDHVNPEDFAL